MASLPYNPTAALNPTNSSLVYLMRPTSDNSNFEVVALDTSKPVSANSPALTTVSNSLPFPVDPKTALVPVADDNGAFRVLAGQCGKGANGTELWTFKADSSTADGNWTQETLSVDGVANPTVNAGTNFLAAGVPFSTISNLDSDIYAFGGMCPNKTRVTVEDWQASGTYSNSLLAFQRKSGAGYTMSTPWNRGPPIGEAGFTLTPLEPTFFDSAKSSGASRQQNFVLLGGQTAGAFTNMSQVALLSLPEETWSFIPVQDPGGSRADLAIRRTSSVDSRSGHAAVLADDGKSVIVVGGWVGDVETPAEPQVAILNLGKGYGGSGPWEWTTPTIQGSGIASGSGLYGHSAVLLPGNVLMVTGGYAISPASSRKAKRAASASSSTYFLNVTTSTWTVDYTNPSPHPSGSGIGASTLSLPTDADNAKQRIGLGAGLGIGLAALLGVLIFYFWYRRRLRRRRHARVLDPHDIAASRGLHSSDFNDEAGYEDRSPEDPRPSMQERQRDGAANPYPWAPAPGAEGALVQGRSIVPGSDAERTGLLIEVPSPTRGLRRSLYSRPSSFHYEDGRRSRGSGHIHRIDEGDEDEAATATGPPGGGGGGGGGNDSPDRPRTGSSRHTADTVAGAPPFDPFRDPTPSPQHVLAPDRHLLDRSRTPSPPSPAARAREREVQTWMRDWTAAADSLMQRQHTTASGGSPGAGTGRASPDRSDRTSSTLSERSAHSARSTLSASAGAGTGASGPSRSASQRSANLLAAVAADTPPTTRVRGAHRRSQSLTLGAETTATRAAGAPAAPSAAAVGAASPGGFARLQAEGRALLGGSPGGGGSGSGSGGAGRARTLLGTVRRALTGGARSAGAASGSATPSPTHPSRPGGVLPASGRPTVQRSASAGAVVWRRRQGARDWDAPGGEGSSGGGGAEARRPGTAGPATAAGPAGAAEDEDEWDVESAVERRVVQVMFTVPKERLRVVNAGPGEDDDGPDEDRDEGGSGGLPGGEHPEDGASEGGEDPTGQSKGKARAT